MKWGVFACLTACCIGLVSCGDGIKGHATPQAAQELAEIRQTDLPALAASDEVEPELVEALNDTLEHFISTMDVHYTPPYSGIGILHMACIFKKPELVRCLLLDGADPNAHKPDDDSPLLLALGTYLTPHAEEQSIISLADILLDGGADMEKSGHAPGDFLTQAAFVCEREGVILHLLRRGAKADASTALPLALHGWAEALPLVLAEQGELRGLLHAVAVGSCRYEGRFADCVELLLRKGADINGDEEEGLHGVSPLFRLAEEMSNMPEDSPHLPQALDMFALLLSRGADPYLRALHEEDYPGFCPYDFLAMRPKLLTALRERGIDLKAPDLSFSSGTALLAEVCRVAAVPPAAEELAPHFERIAGILTPSPEMRQHDLYPQALEAAAALLARLGAERASQAILGMSLWEDATPQAQSALNSLLSALRDNTSLVLPKEFICRTAERWAQEGRADEAAALAELLARCPDAEQELAALCTSPDLPLQAGAYAARLYREQLPDARNGGVEAWLSEHGRTADTPFLQEALLLTSLEKLWEGQMPAAEQRRMFELMRRIGAPTAAEAYEQIARCLDNPTALDELMQRGDAWKFELEAATARFFLDHKADFSTP